MEKKSKTEKLKLKGINQALLVSSYNSGTGTGPNDCMSEAVFLKLCEQGALKDAVYVCGWGWTAPETTIYGSGAGSCDEFGSGFDEYGSGFGSGYWGSGSGSGYWGSGTSGGGGTSGGDGSNPTSKAPIELMDKTKFVGWVEGANCRVLCEQTLAKYGQSNYGKSDNVFRLVDSSKGFLTNWGDNPAENYKNAIECIDKHLNARRVIIVGVDYDPDSNANSDGTDHFIVITGRGYDTSRNQYYYTFMDNAASKADDGCSNINRLYYRTDKPKLEGSTKPNRWYYTVTHVRPNDGGKYKTTSL
ncbi:hypothetical protein [Bacteroides sp.]|uniref:hypothetical protein n=1 Tax=Bacteroides sp. TaxID=29523 RepID=UPI00261FBBF9|nr:hypothetical protein [Bacteroides sp.]MDD3038883.1 hypothetical protein [Bacteroides sp.]